MVGSEYNEALEMWGAGGSGFATDDGVDDLAILRRRSVTKEIVDESMIMLGWVVEGEDPAFSLNTRHT